jgi:putative addiction module component (TIGR02574 family)
MSRSVAQLFDEASVLAEQDRANLAGLLLETLEPPRDQNVEQAWAAEVERRSREISSGKVSLVAWEDVKERLLAG